MYIYTSVEFRKDEIKVEKEVGRALSKLAPLRNSMRFIAPFADESLFRSLLFFSFFFSFS